MGSLLGVVVWPLLVLILVVRYGSELRRFVDSLCELTFKAAGIEATAKRSQVEAAVALGAATARSSADSASGDDEPEQIAGVISDNVTPRSVRRLSESRVLWVDERPSNNVYERRSLEALGVHFDISTSTDDALEKVERRAYDAIISDMGRPPDSRAGYTLLEKLRGSGNMSPFVIYAGSNLPEHKAEARKRGAQGSTNRPTELFELVLSSLTGGSRR